MHASMHNNNQRRGHEFEGVRRRSCSVEEKGRNDVNTVLMYKIIKDIFKN